MTTLIARHQVIDDFLDAGDADRLLDQMLAREASFTPSEVTVGKDGTLAPAFRSSLRLPGRVGVDLTGFTAAVHARFEALCAATGLTPFPIDHTERSIVAHRQGDFYRRHVDTGAAHRGHVRILSSVYYLHRRPVGFSGGELALYPFAGDGDPTLVAPLHNRLVVFPAFVPHEVLPTTCPGGFADSRFSINCWLHRAVGPAAEKQA
jgi:Rps23 Pro-64 3,4-dihydroxylase Tpa1-like proline 4-hydroxylase